MYRCPVIISRIINGISNRNDTHACITQVFQLHKSLAVSTGKSTEVLYNKYTDIPIHQLLAKLPISFTLFKGIPGPVTVFIYRKLTLGKLSFYKLFDNFLLVLDGGIVSA